MTQAIPKQTKIKYSDMKNLGRPKTILHCDLNNFFASVELLDHPELAHLPVVVGGSVEERQGIVLAKNYEAKKYGIVTAEPIWKAKEKCRSLIVLPTHYHKYVEYSAAVRKIYSRYTDQVEAMGIDECFLDVTGSLYLYGDGETIAHRIREEVKRETGLTISVGVSFNKVFAKLGSDMKKPDAVTVIPKDSFREIIWSLPASDMLGVGRRIGEKLRQRSIRTIGDIARCPRDLLRSYLGKHGDTLWMYANGLDTSPVLDEGYTPPLKSIGHGTTTLSDLKNEREVKNVIIALTDDIGTSLRRNSLKCGGVAVGIRENDFSYREYQMKFERPTQLRRDISESASELFHRRHVWNNDIRSVTVRAIYISSDSAPEQLDLFYDDTRERRLLSLEKTTDALKARFGKGLITEAVQKTDDKVSRHAKIGFTGKLIGE
ncbi:MAG: DNA polymerase IV [Clostridia bacterium]|nr:DNA polymerase IV [Clostridia bacterium]